MLRASNAANRLNMEKDHPMKLPRLVGKAESTGWTRIDVTVQAAIIAALSATVGVGITTYSSQASTNQTMKLSCVKRIDDQEDKLRARAETLLTSIAKLTAYPAHPNPTSEALANHYDAVVVAGQSLIANAPPFLAVKTMHLIGRIMKISMPTDDAAENAKNISEFQAEIIPWHQAYFDQMRQFEIDRVGC
jgi:hypothetical protein